MAAADPAILTSYALEAAAKGDIKDLMAEGKDGFLDLLNVTHSSVSVAEFASDVRDWMKIGKHPETGLLCIDMTYQPMLELLIYQRDEGFAINVGSGGGGHFMRPLRRQPTGFRPSR